jgi:hypothetical protein
MAETLQPSYFKSVLTVVPAAARLLDRGRATISENYENTNQKIRDRAFSRI